MAPKILPKRETRGKRMNALVGKAIEDDEAFWNSGFFGEPEGSEDDDYQSAQDNSSQGRDSFDSDFLKGSQSGGAASDNNEDQTRKKSRSNKIQFDEDFDSEEERAALDNDRRE